MGSGSSIQVFSIKKMKPHFYIGLFVIVVSEILLFLGERWVSMFFTPLVWTGYILFIDGVVYRIKRKSLLTTNKKTFWMMFPLSSGFWFVFEFYNLFIKNWKYEGLPSIWLTAIGMIWAFAIIGPGILETTEFLKSVGAFNLSTRGFKIPNIVLRIVIVIGILCLLAPLVAPYRVSKYLATPLWFGFVFLLDPINCMNEKNSIFREWQEGNFQNFLCLFFGGLICGFLWELWNYWAATGWIYQIPYYLGPKIFEMPLLGYLGFPLLAMGYYAFYSFVLRKNQQDNRVESLILNFLIS